MQYNPEEVQFGTLVDLFYSRHDSTTPNRAGNDVGTQYRSGIYYQDDEQKKVRTTSKPKSEVHIFLQLFDAFRVLYTFLQCLSWLVKL